MYSYHNVLAFRYIHTQNIYFSIYLADNRWLYILFIIVFFSSLRISCALAFRETIYKGDVYDFCFYYTLGTRKRFSTRISFWTVSISIFYYLKSERLSLTSVTNTSVRPFKRRKIRFRACEPRATYYTFLLVHTDGIRW